MGCGSIGVRHLQALEEIGNFEMAAYRTEKGTKRIPEALRKRLRFFFDEEKAFAWQPDFMIVSNPTSLHSRYLLKAIELNIDTFIEKPVTDNYEEIRDIRDKIKKRKNKVYVGFNLRFHPIVREVSRIISTSVYGRVLKADLYVGQYLPSWHPYEDYRASYAARKELGGGAIRTLCHEVDLGQYWFGDYDKVFARVTKISGLDIDVDDNTDILAEMKNGILLKITMDYLNPVLERRGSILFQQGLLEYNLPQMTIVFADYATKECRPLLGIEDYDYDTQYRYQMEGFINKSHKEICTLEEGINVARVIEKCEQSSRTGRLLRV